MADMITRLSESKTNEMASMQYLYLNVKKRRGKRPFFGLSLTGQTA